MTIIIYVEVLASKGLGYRPYYTGRVNRQYKFNIIVVICEIL